MKAIVTGFDGFIGKHLVRRLIAEEYEVSVFKGDVTSEKDVQVGIQNVDIVYHLAAISDVREAEINPEQAFRVNVIGTYLLAKRALDVGVGKFVFMSSSAVYGEFGGSPSEECHKCNPVSVYGLTKYQAENCLNMLSDQGLPTLIIRLGNTVGPGCKVGIIPELIERSTTDGNTTNPPASVDVYGDGHQVRTYMWIHDLLDALMRLNRIKVKPTGVINVSGIGPVEIRELVKAVLPGMDVNYTGQYGDLAWSGDIWKELISINKAEDFGWKPTMNSIEVVERTAKELRRAVNGRRR